MPFALASASTSPPIAAQTVAFGIQAKAMNALSVQVNFFSNAAKKVPHHLALTPRVITTNPYNTWLGSILEKITAAPTVPNKNG